VALTKVTSAVIKDATITDADIGSTLTTAISGSTTALSSSIATRFDSREVDMTLATASIALNESNMTLATASIAAITASLGQPVNTDSNVTFNDINSTGTITAVEVHTTFVSSSITVASGSNNFGDALDDHHSFTGSLSISGSGTVTGSFTVNGPSTIDELTATSLTATGNISSSITSTGSFGGIVTTGTGVNAFLGGNVGIGTGAPGAYTGIQSNLEVKSSTHGGIAINAGTNSLGMLAFAAGGTHRWSIESENSATPYLGFNEAGTYRMIIDNGGNVGIGANTAPDTKLHIQTSDASLTTADANASVIIEENDHTYLELLTPNDKQSGIIFSDGAIAGLINYNHSTNAMDIQTAGTSAITIDSSQDTRFKGDIYIPNGGDISPGDSGAGQLDIFGGGTNKGGYIKLRGGGNSGDIKMFTGTSGDGTERMSIESGGVITVHAGIKYSGTNNAAPTGDDHLDEPIKHALFEKAVDADDVTAGSIDFDVDIGRGNVISMNGTLYDANLNVNHFGMSTDETWLKEITMFASGGVRVYFGSSVAATDTVKLIISFFGNTG